MKNYAKKEIKKMAATKKEVEKPIEKKSYEVRVEAMVPATLYYRVLAVDPEEAIKLIKGRAPNNIRYVVPAKRDLKIMVYRAGQSIIELVKTLGTIR